MSFIFPVTVQGGWVRDHNKTNLKQESRVFGKLLGVFLLCLLEMLRCRKQIKALGMPEF